MAKVPPRPTDGLKVLFAGLFSADGFRNAFFEELGKPIAAHNYTAGVEDTLDALAAHLETHFDINRLLELAAGCRSGRDWSDAADFATISLRTLP